MSKGKVKLDLDEYNSLRDFKEKMDKKHGKTVFIDWHTQRYISTDEAVKEIAATNEKLQEDIKKWQSICDEQAKYKFELDELKASLPKQKTLGEVKKLSIWEFMKWRKA